MQTAERILDYLKNTYQPDAIIVYGSFADGSAGKNSDFDALVMADHEKMHDASVIGGTVLDVFVYPAETFRSDYDPERFVQIWDGTIVLDKNGAAGRLQKRVLDYIAHIPPKTAEEIRQEIGWCEKMVSRTLRGDAEGYYRWHWVLIDSLEIYFDVKGRYYCGPKKALRLMEKTDTEAFEVYSRALSDFKGETLSAWIAYLKNSAPS